MMKYATREIKVDDNEYLVFYDNDERLYDVDESIRIGKRLSILNQKLFSDVNNLEDLIKAFDEKKVTSPSDMVENPIEVSLNIEYQPPVIVGPFQTTGTGGNPKETYFTYFDNKRFIYQWYPIINLLERLSGRNIAYISTLPPQPAPSKYMVFDIFAQHLNNSLRLERSEKRYIFYDVGIWLYGKPGLEELLVKRLEKIVEREDIDSVVFMATPTRFLKFFFPHYFIKNPKARKKVEMIMLGAEYTPKEIIQFMWSEFDNLEYFVDVYGTTEFGVTALKVLDNQNPTSSPFYPRATLFVLPKPSKNENSRRFTLTKLYGHNFPYSFIPLINYDIGDYAIVYEDNNGKLGIYEINREREFEIEMLVGKSVRKYYPYVIDYLVLEKEDEYRVLLGILPTLHSKDIEKIKTEIITDLFSNPRFLAEKGEKLRIEAIPINELEEMRRQIYPSATKTLHYYYKPK